MEERYETTKCSYENDCRKCSLIYMKTPGNLHITGVTDDCSIYYSTIPNTLAVFSYNNRTSQHFFRDRCCVGERQVFFRMENVETDGLTTKESSQETTDVFIPEITSSHYITTTDVTRSIWFPTLLGTVGFLILLAFIFITKMCYTRSKRYTEKRRDKNGATMNNTPEYSTIEKTNDSLSDGQIWINLERNSNSLENHSDSKHNLFDGEDGVYNSLFEKKERTVEDCGPLYNHLCEFDNVDGDFDFPRAGECTREMTNAEYSCLEAGTG